MEAVYCDCDCGSGLTTFNDLMLAKIDFQSTFGFGGIGGQEWMISR